MLKHVGVLGMRWGHRRTPSSEHVESSKLRKKKVYEMSNEELRKYNTRIELIKKYKEANPGKIKKAVKRVDGVITTIGKLSAAVGTITAAAVAGKKIYDKYKPYVDIMVKEVKS